MKKLGLSWILALVAIVFFINGCAAPQPKYMKQTLLGLTEHTESRQIKGGITIEVKPVDLKKEYNKARYKSKFRVKYLPFLADKFVTKDIETQVALFDQLLPLEVTVINDTDHILRMRDSRVVFIEPGSDEPVLALDKNQIYEDYEILPIRKKLEADFIKKYTLSPDSDMDMILEKGLKKIIKKVKFVNAFNREIMPGMKYSGLVVFPINPEEASEGKVSFIDMISRTDNAGNPTHKVRFDYRVKPIYKYYRYNSSTDKDWVEINESEYQGT